MIMEITTRQWITSIMKKIKKYQKEQENVMRYVFLNSENKKLLVHSIQFYNLYMHVFDNVCINMI